MIKDEFDLFREDVSGKDRMTTIILENPNAFESTKEFVGNFECTKPCIMVVDDDINVRESIHITFKKKYNVLLCSNGDEGIKKVNSNISAVVLDIKMEGKNGFETFIELKKKSAYVPIIFHSAYQDLKNPYEIMNDYHPFGYVVKGGEGRELMHTIESAVDYYNQISKNEILVRQLLQNIEDKRKAEEYLIRLNFTYQKFVPKQFLEFLGRSDITEIQLGDQTQKEMSVLFGDIRSFTTLSETMTSDENFKFINSYLKRITPQIIKNNGFIDKYIGDGVMALFPENANDSVNAGISMLDELYIYNKHRKAKNYKPISIGIGIHSGNLTLGIVGNTNRMEGTVISDVVNLASRMEGLTKLYGASILISETTYQKLKDPSIYFFRIVDTVKVKGKKEPVTVIEILNGNSSRIIDLKLSTKRDFEFGTALYQEKDFTEAKSCFRKVLEKDPQDKAAEIYLKRSEYYEVHGITPEWEGIEALESK